ncbi:MAG: hypothetical protein ACD_12C00474G0001, partial [uncultured bacterium]
MGIIGFIALFKKNKNLFLLFFPGFFFIGPLFIIIMRVPPISDSLKAFVERFYLPSFYIFSISISYGIYFIYKILFNKFIASQNNRIKIAILIIFFSFLPFSLLIKNYPRLDFHSYNLSETYGQDLMKSFDKNSIVLVQGDTSIFTLWYLQRVEKQRTDLKIINTSVAEWYREQLYYHFPDIIIPFGIETDYFINEFIKLNISKYKIYVVGVLGDKFQNYGIANNPFSLQPKGLVWQIVDSFNDKDNDQSIWDSYKFDKKVYSGNNSPYFIKEIFYLYALSHYNKAVIFYQK